jgi:hypothetical protein
MGVDVCHIYRRCLQKNEARLREDHLSRGTVKIKLPNERPFGIPDVDTIAATPINVSHGIKLNPVGSAGFRVGEHSAVRERLCPWINIELVAIRFASESRCNHDCVKKLTSWPGKSDSLRGSLQKHQYRY